MKIKDLKTVLFLGIYFLICSLSLSGQTTRDTSIINPVTSSDPKATGICLQESSFTKGFITSVPQLVMGKIPGLCIQQEDGAPGSSFTATTLWNYSFISSSSPLYVVDNKPLYDMPLTISPGDIESIIFSRDAFPTAKYGIKAENGVLFIKTKRGSERLSVHYSGKVSFSAIQKDYDVFSADGFREFINERYSDNPDAISQLGTDDTDWSNEVFRNAMAQDHYLSLSGSVVRIPMRFSAGKTVQEGIIKTTSFDRSYAAFSVTPSLMENRLNINVSSRINFENRHLADEDLVYNTMIYDPTRPIYSQSEKYDGFYQWSNYIYSYNPVAILNQTDNSIGSRYRAAALNIEYQLEKIPFKVTFDYVIDDYTDDSRMIQDTTDIRVYEYGRELNEYTYKKSSYISSCFYLTIPFKNISSELAFQGGFLTQTTDKEYENIYAYINPQYTYNENESSTNLSYKSYYATVSFSFLKKYQLMLGMVDDDAPFISNSTQQSTIPSASFVWDIKNESFLTDNNLINDLRLYLSYSKRITTSDDNNIIDTDPLSRESFSARINFAALNNRIKGSLGVTDNISKNQTLYTMTSFSSGYIVSYRNIADFEIKGLDFTLEATPVSGHNLRLDIALNAALVSNKLTGFKDREEFTSLDFEGWAYLSGTAAGQSVNSFWVMEQLYDESGYPVWGDYADRNPNGSLDFDDRYLKGSKTPQMSLGLSANLIYKNLTLGCSGRMYVGNYVYNFESALLCRRRSPYYDGYYENLPVALADVKLHSNSLTGNCHSDYFLEEASFFRMDYISLGYRFNNIIVNKVTLGLRAVLQNAFVITAYSGPDPEVADGISGFSYPRARTASLEISLDF